MFADAFSGSPRNIARSAEQFSPLSRRGSGRMSFDARGHSRGQSRMSLKTTLFRRLSRLRGNDGSAAFEIE